MKDTVDFTNCLRLVDRAYNGANGKKIAVEYEGRPYMLKFPPSGDGKPTELSYTNSCISEHVVAFLTFSVSRLKKPCNDGADKITRKHHRNQPLQVWPVVFFSLFHDEKKRLYYGVITRNIWAEKRARDIYILYVIRHRF